ncbi:MAG: hypothetical protein WC700_14415 [Gemmatimonadaceae bacterium]|jgi:hypothetical protein
MEAEFLGGAEPAETGADPFSETPANDPFLDDEAAAPADPNAAPAPETPAPDGIETPEPETAAIPFKYQADGQEVAFEGIEEIPGEGAIVSVEALPRLRDQLQRADHLGRQIGEYSRTVDRFQKVGGFERMEQLEANAAVLQSVGKKFLEILAEDGAKTEDGYPAALAELATDPRARALMLRELDVLTRDAELRARGTFRSTMQGVDRAGQEGANRTQAITGAVSEMGKAITAAFGVTLPPEDLAEAEQVFGQFAESIYRPASAQEAATLRVPVGSPIIDYPKMHPWFTARAQLRQRETATRSSAATASAENAARLAATTPTRPATTRAAIQRPGTGTKVSNPKLNPNRPDITDWKMRMRMGLSPIADAPANP